MAEDRINNFTGGQTDRRLDGPSNFFRKAQNLYITENFKLARRAGLRSYNNSFVDPFGAQAIWSMYKHVTTRSSGYSFDSEHDLFLFSNGAFAYHPSDPSFGYASAAYLGNTPTVPAALDSQNYAHNFTRLNDDEFVFLPGGIGNNDLLSGLRPLKFFRQLSVLGWKIVTLGLPRFNQGVTPNVTVDFAGGGTSYVYALVLRHTYTTLSGLTKIVRGEPLLVPGYESGGVGDMFPVGPNNPGITSEADIDFSAFTSATLSSFRDADNAAPSSSGSCFDYSNVKIEIYRTQSNGTILRKIGEVANTASTFHDDITDDEQEEGELLYTTGNVTGNGMFSDEGRYATFANNCLWIATQTDLYQSKAGIYDALPGSYNSRPPQNPNIVDLASIDVHPIVFSDIGVFRVEGIIDDLGNGSHRYRSISEKIKCIAGSVVKAQDTLFFWAEDGIYETDGFRVKKVSNHLNDTYNARVGKYLINNAAQTNNRIKLIRKTWDDKNRRVYWLFPSSDQPFNGYTNSSVMLDMKYQHQDGYAIVFDAFITEHPVTAVESHNGDLYIGTNTGQVLRQDQDYTSDIDPASTSQRVPIIYDYMSTSMAFGTERIRKWFTKVIAHFRNLTDLTVTLMSDTDDSDDWREHKPIRERGYVGGINYVTRWFPKGKIRGTHKAFRFTNSVERALYRSSDYDTASVAFISGSWKANIDSGSFPGSTQTIVNQSFRWSVDNYATAYPITAFSAATLTLAGVMSTESNIDWEIWGVPMDEKFELDGYTVEFASSGVAHLGSVDEGTNAG